MQIFEKIRAYHASLIALTSLSYVTGEAGEIHELLGYGVAALIVFRVLWGLVGPRQVGISRFFPNISDLRQSRLNDPAFSRMLICIVALLLITTTVTGIMLEGTPAKQHQAFLDGSKPALSAEHEYASQQILPKAYADDAADRGGKSSEWLEEVHELAANLLVVAVAVHVLYLLIFKRPLALFMLFVRRPDR